MYTTEHIKRMRTEIKERFGYSKEDMEDFLKSIGYKFIKTLESNNDNVYMHIDT